MGYGINAGCRCKNRELMLGVGMGHSIVYRETMNEIRSGKYGDEMKGLVDSEKYIAVDVENYIYYCEGCGCIECFRALDLYEPKNTEKVGKRIIGRWSAGEEYNTKTVKDNGGLMYFAADDEDYKLMKEYKHVCPECGKVMERVSEEELAKKICPMCGEKYQVFPGMLWD